MQFFHDTLIEKALDQTQHPTIRNPLADQRQQAIFGDRIEVALQIRVDDVHVTGCRAIPQRHRSASWQPRPWRKPKLRSWNVCVQDWLDDMDHSRLHDAVPDGGNSQRTLLRFTSFLPFGRTFGNPDAAYR